MPRFTGKVSFVTKPDKTLHARATYVNRQGKRKEKWARVWTTKAAAKEAVIAKIEKALVEEDESGVLTFRQLADQYTETYAIAPVYVHDEKVKGMEAWRQVRSVVNDLAAYFGETPLDWITRGTIQAYRVHIFEKPAKGKQRSLASINQHLRILRTVLNVAESEKWIDRAPSFKGLISNAAEATRQAMPTEAEFLRVLEATQKRPRLHHILPIVLLIADTGARPKELWRLTWPDLDLEGRTITLTSYKGKRVLRRTLPLSDRAHAELVKVSKLNEYVFGGIKDIKRGWKSIQQLAGVTFTPYSLRHFFATRIDMMPISQNQKEKLLGHTSGAMFGRYAKLTEKTLDDVRGMLNDMPLIDSSTSIN